MWPVQHIPTNPSRWFLNTIVRSMGGRGNVGNGAGTLDVVMRRADGLVVDGRDIFYFQRDF